MDWIGLSTMLTHAASRFLTTLLAILRASRIVPHVTSTMRLCLLRTIISSPVVLLAWPRLGFFLYSLRARIARYDFLSHQVRHVRLARLDRRRFYICQCAPGGHRHR